MITIAMMDPEHPLVYTAEWEDEPDGNFPGPGRSMTMSEMEASIERVLGVPVTLTPPPDGAPTLLRRLSGRNTRVADVYRDRRVFLVGDATHVHSATGGPGLNLALQDAANLAWKLAADLHGWAPDGLLDSYETERHPLGRRVFIQTQAQAALMAPGPDVTALRELVGELLTDTANVQHVADLLAGADVRYDMGESEPDELTGWFAPSTDLALADGQKERVAHIQAATSTTTTSMLVRPDGYVAWSGHDPARLRAALERWFGSPPTSGGESRHVRAGDSRPRSEVRAG